MTITYQRKVATTSFFGFFRLLKAWRGSVYKLIYKETLVFCLLYTIISLIYRLGLSGDSKRTFERLVAHCESYTNLIPVSFVLGFYVSLVVGRWWTQFTNFPWPDRTLYIMGSYVVGRDDASRIIRRTVARYMMAAQILILRSVSVSVMKRFPTMEHIVNAGFLTDDEVIDLENVNCKYHKFWVPLVWANTVITNARREGKITSDYGFQFVIQQLADYRDRLSICFVFDWITVPLVYTQVVTLAVYIFFGACLIGRQYVDNDKGNIDLYVPVFTLLQFLFYMGWLKVAEQLINPFGEDDDDFDMNWLMDRHVGAMWCLVDYCHQVVPALVKDMHFNEIVTEELPYTEASMASRRPNFMGSTYNMERPSLDHQRIVPNPELYDMNHNGSFAGLRQRSRSHVTHGDSNWSLFRDKESLQMSHSHTNLDIKSNQVPNGLPPKGPLDVSLTSLVNASRHVRKGSIDSRTSEISYLSCAESPATEQLPEYTPLKRAEKDRKWSFPLNLLHRKSSKEDIEHAQTHPLDVNNESDDSLPLLNAIASNKGGRFQVDMVPGDHDVDASKQARNKQIIDKHMGYMAVSRAPALSAIEEGGTVRSVKEILTSSRASSVSSLNGEVNHNGESEIPPTIVEEDGNPDDAFPLPIKTEKTSLLTCVCACEDHSIPHDSVTVDMDNEGTFQGRLLVDRSERPSIPEITVDHF